jgi:translocator protein
VETPLAQRDRAKWLGLAAWLGITFLAAAIGSQFEPGAWYGSLDKPSWTPPNAVFGPVWTVLYLLMAIAAWLVWSARGFSGARTALTLYLLQLALNTAWSWLFFGEHRIGLALLDIVVLWLLIAATLVLFWRIRPVAGWLLVPYLVWVGYAAALNYAIFQANT